MKNSKLIFLALFSLVLSIIEMVWYGTIKDNENISGTDYINVFFITIAIIPILIIVLKLIKKEGVITSVCTIVMVIIVAMNMFFLGLVYEKSNFYAINKDYIQGAFIRGITLDELEKTIASDEENVVYIGRNDCSDCIAFEDAYEDILKKYSVEATGYYTNLDRDNDNADRMYEIIKNYNITEVPALVVVKNSKLIKRFNVENINEIEDYYNNNF